MVRVSLPSIGLDRACERRRGRRGVYRNVARLYGLYLSVEITCLSEETDVLADTETKVLDGPSLSYIPLMSRIDQLGSIGYYCPIYVGIFETAISLGMGVDMIRVEDQGEVNREGDDEELGRCGSEWHFLASSGLAKGERGGM